MICAICHNHLAIDVGRVDSRNPSNRLVFRRRQADLEARVLLVPLLILKAVAGRGGVRAVDPLEVEDVVRGKLGISGRENAERLKEGSEKIITTRATELGKEVVQRSPVVTTGR